MRKMATEGQLLVEGGQLARLRAPDEDQQRFVLGRRLGGGGLENHRQMHSLCTHMRLGRRELCPLTGLQVRPEP